MRSPRVNRTARSMARPRTPLRRMLVIIALGTVIDADWISSDI